jgi:hypothetical protein
MLHYFRTNQFIPKLLIVSLLYLTAFQPAHAGIVSSAELVADQQEQIARDNLLLALDREDVRSALQAQGVNPDIAKQRVATMTSEEVQLLNQKMDEMPAGGDIVAAAVLVFLVLLFTDIMGYTDLFPFVKKTAK